MTGETDNPDLGTDNAHPISETDSLAEYDYYDPEEDTVVDQTEAGIEDETQETEPEAEVSTEEVVAEVVEEVEPQAEGEQAPVSEDTPVKMADGSTVTVKDLIAGSMRQADYTRKSQENANYRKQVEADAEQIAGITEAFVDYLTSMVPAEPSPALAQSDYQKYVAQKAQHDAGMVQIQKLIELGQKPKEIVGERTKEEHQKLIQDEMHKLSLAVPETATEEGRKKFFNDVRSVAEEVGFPISEIQQITDHRVFVLASLAKEGLAAREAKVKVREKVQQAVPATPRKPGQLSQQPNRNKSAMSKLRQSGSIEDAMMVDFE